MVAYMDPDGGAWADWFFNNMEVPWACARNTRIGVVGKTAADHIRFGPYSGYQKMTGNGFAIILDQCYMRIGGNAAPDNWG